MPGPRASQFALSGQGLRSQHLRGLWALGMLLLLWVPMSVVAEDPADAAPANAFCPVMEGEATSPEFYVDYRGVRIYMCCENCVELFPEFPEAYIGNLPPEMQKKLGVEPGGAPGEGRVVTLPPRTMGERIVRFVGKFHPPLTHFPIALLAAGLLAELLGWRRSPERPTETGKFCVLLAGAAAPVTAGIGWAAGWYARYLGAMDDAFLSHRLLGTIAAGVILGVAFLAHYSSREGDARTTQLFRIMLIAAMLLVGAAAFHGGALTHGVNHYKF